MISLISQFMFMSQIVQNYSLDDAIDC